MTTGIAFGLTEESLILRLRSTEHDFVERKPRGDKSGWLQTAVAFANSAPIGWPAILFVGVDDDGNPQQGTDKLEDLMKSVSDTLDRAYPAIYRQVVPVHVGDLACLAVVVPGSESRPHFAGQSYVRVGPQTKPASEEQYELLIAERQSKAREILKWKGRDVNLNLYLRQEGRTNTYGGKVTVLDCNQFFVTLEKVTGNPFGTNGGRASYPLARVDLSGCSDGLVLEVVQGY